MSIARVYRALVEGFNGIELSTGQYLTSSTDPKSQVPSLTWALAGWQSEFWQPFKSRVQWDVPALLRVQGEPHNHDVILNAIDDVDNWCSQIYGLPVAQFVTDTGEEIERVVPFGEQQQELERLGRLESIAERFAGPYINRVTIRPDATDNSFSVADLLFRVEFVLNYEPRVTASARFFQVGANIYDPARTDFAPGEKYDVRRPPEDDDRKMWTAFAKPDTTLNYGGRVVHASFPPVVHDVPSVEGSDPETTLIRLDVIPGAASVAALATQQMLAQGGFKDGGTISLTAAATWSSSDEDVATVSSAGLVTGVASGTCTITATYNGISGTAVITVP